jgi:D-aspartate ligase
VARAAPQREHGDRDIIATMSNASSKGRRMPLACVIGDMDLLRPLVLAGIPCATVASTTAPQWYSRFNVRRVPWDNAWERADELVGRLIEFGASQPVPPVLFFQHDSDLLLVSRHRERLAPVFRFLLADPELIEDLVDKERFQTLAQQLNLPIPRALSLAPEDTLPRHLDLRFPLIVKPSIRQRASWSALGEGRKAVRIDSPSELAALWSKASRAGVRITVQELIAGDESAIESYHVYVDRSDRIVAAFTGRKLRTYPATFGDSTALITTDAEDVAALGRQIVTRLRLRGVAKLDFKRDAAGALALLEINPRFTLWHHLGARAGLNIPALVYHELAGSAPPRETVRARTGVRWCRVWPDVKAAHDQRIPLIRWMTWALGCEAKSTVAWDDPGPLDMAVVGRVFHRERSAPPA